VERHEQADAPHAFGLLRTRRERRSSCHAADSDEIAPPHVPPRPEPRKSESKASTQRSIRHATRCPLWKKLDRPPERDFPCAHAPCAREKSLKNFRLVPLRRRYGQRCRALAVISPSSLINLTHSELSRFNVRDVTGDTLRL